MIIAYFSISSTYFSVKEKLSVIILIKPCECKTTYKTFLAVFL